MCFSAEASFAAGGVLIPAGAYCIYSAARKQPRYLGLAAVPLFFGIQQIGEGFVWTALHHGDAEQKRNASLFFLFFALAFWPFWFPLLTTIMEPERRRRWIFAAMTVAASAWFWILYYPLLVGPNNVLDVRVEHHSVQYQYDSLAIYDYIDRGPLRILYLLSVALPPIFGSEKWGRIPGLVLGLSALVAAVFYHYAFVSVWCFFAAILALYLFFFFYRLPTPASAEIESSPIEEAGAKSLTAGQ
ncbi:MAG TPA: DUF6629 family protein [Gemmataceae bacterium]|nr:DUF6629 family protein [Gemmataceae bacterium]